MIFALGMIVGWTLRSFGNDQKYQLLYRIGTNPDGTAKDPEPLWLRFVGWIL